MKMTRNKVIGLAVIVAVLAVAYMWGGGYARPAEPAPSSPPVSEEQGQEPDLSADVSTTDAAPEQETTSPADLSAPEPAEPSKTTAEPVPPEIALSSGGKQLSAEEKLALAAAGGDKSSPGVQKGSEEYSEDQGMVIDPKTGKDKYLTGPVPEGRPVPVEPQDVVIGETTYTCTLSVECGTILDNMKYLDKNKVELVPEDGIIFPATEVTFYEGESVLNILQREMKKNKIHMEFVNMSIYNSAYIEGINNLYEFDCGELSGWMYKVNDWFPSYGCSRYQLQDGDVVEWVYTCDLGRDVGGYYAVGGS
ncbi:MAG: DUF4430 domain-containing protein [Bacillota bacterium]